MAITSAICSSFKQELLQGKHSFESSGGHTFKIALFHSDASLGAATTDYSTSEEITNTSGSAYTAGGAALTNAGVSLSSTTAGFFWPEHWPTSTTRGGSARLRRKGIPERPC